MTEYELAGIETIARGICIHNGKILLCRAKGGSTSYLPGGHIEFGETGREALIREMKEETGLDVVPAAFRGVMENKFMQHGKPHAEINLVYSFELDAIQAKDVTAREDWIEFFWQDLATLEKARPLPETVLELKNNPSVIFSV